MHRAKTYSVSPSQHTGSRGADVGYEWTEEQRESHSRMMKEFWADPDNREKMLERIRAAPPNETVFKKGLSPWNKGLKTGIQANLGNKHSDETKEKISEASKRMWANEEFKERKLKELKEYLNLPESKEENSRRMKELWEDPDYRKNQSEKHMGSQNHLGFTHSPETRKKISDKVKGRFGPESANWKGGITPENAKIRGSPEMATWRKFVFERDDYQCQECLKWSGELRAHHCKSFAEYPRLRFQTWNGLTLCKDCHQNYHGGIG